MEQGSYDWYMARLGKVTASRVADVIAKTKTGVSASRANYAAELLAERLTGVPNESFCSPDMQWGKDNEADARASYSATTFDTVTEAGFINHPSIEMSGASPDGLVGDDGLLEIKCPRTNTHIETLLSGKIPTKYETQMTWQMLCTGRKWCDFVSYDPRLPPHLQIFTKRFFLDPARGAELEREVIAFLREIETTITELNASYGVAA